MKFLDMILSNQLYLIYLAGVMIISGIIKEHQLFADFYALLLKKVSSKRGILVIVSAVSGILPIPGRVVVSAGVLSTMAPEDKNSRSKFGLIDYLSTHHYYLWSPLEKTVIIPMAVLGLSYIQFLKYSLPLLLISLGYICWYIFTRIDEKDIQIKNNGAADFNLLSFCINVLPLITGIGLLITGIVPYIIFTVLAVYYAVITGSWRDYKTIFKYINFKLIFFLALVIIAGNIIKQHYNEIEAFLSAAKLDIHSLPGILLISVFAFGSAFALGSSSKFAALTVILVSIYGIQYLTFFLALEFSGYLLSPVHKCVAIGKMYFGTPLRNYVSVISGWCVLMITYSTISTFI